MNFIGKEAFVFMRELYDNNRKEWFDANRKRYETSVKKPMKALAEALSGPVMSILPDFAGKYKISRINNDIRFNPDKPPYKEHMWISFGTGVASGADLFAGISRQGWAVGACTCSSKREDMEGWRKNLLEHTDIWRRYAKEMKMGDKVTAHHQGAYKRPLFADIPEDIFPLVQSKGIWIVEDNGFEFSVPVEQAFFQGLCRMLPLYLFMVTPVRELIDSLQNLADQIDPPTPEIKRLLAIFKS